MLARRLDLEPVFASILTRMGLAEEATARQFLFPRLRNLHDPFEITGIGPTGIDYLNAEDDPRKQK